MSKSKKVIKPNVVGGGVAIPLGNNFYFMNGRKHEQGGIDVGPDNKNGLEVEDGEVMQMGGKHVKVYSSLPILNGKSPAELVIAGLDPNKVFNAQERFKDVNKLNDDGTRKARFGTNRHFTINGNVVNRAGYVPSTGERKKAVTGTITKEEFLSQLPNNNLTIVDDNTTIETNNVIKPDLSTLRNNPKFQSRPYDLIGEMSNTINKIKIGNTPKGYISENGFLIPTLDTFKKQEVQKMINESVRRSNERTAPTNIKLGRLTQNDIIELNDTLQDPTKKLRIDQKDSIQKQLDDNCKYGYTCATTASSNMPRLKDVTKGEGIGYKDRNFMDWDGNILVDPGYFASNSDFRKNYKDYGYDLIDDVNHPSGDKDYKEFVNNLQRGDLVQRWTTDDSGFAPRHLMTYVGNDGGDILYVNDSTGQFTPSAIRKNHEYKLLNPEVGTSAYRFIGDKKDNETMENIYKHLYKNQKRLGGNRKQAELGIEEQLGNLYSSYLRAKKNKNKKEAKQIRKQYNELNRKNSTDYKVAQITKFKRKDGTYLKNVKIDPNSGDKNENINIDTKKWFKNNGSDVISGITKGGASLASYLINKGMLDDLKYVGQPIFTPAAKLKTKVDYNPLINEVKRNTEAKNANIIANTSSSKVRNARINANYLESLGTLNKIFADKENKETELINKDKLNQQEITKANIASYNDWAEKKQAFENNVRDKQSENAVSFVSNLATGVDDILSNRLKRKQFDQNIAALMAGHPNVSPELLGDVGVTVVTDRAPKKDEEEVIITRLGGTKKNKYKYKKYNK